MQVIYKKSVMEKILKERQNADLNQKRIEYIHLNESEARELCRETLKNPMQVPRDIFCESEETLFRRGNARVYGVDVRWDVEDETF